MPRLILASSSPRRRELLSEAGYAFELLPPRPEAEDEAPRRGAPTTLVADLARRKGEDVVRRMDDPDAWVLAADTVAECNGEVLGKPADEADARRILRTLSGTRHSVLTGVCLWQATRESPAALLVVESILQMKTLDNSWLVDYLLSGAWRGKAGAFGYQDGLGFVEIIAGTASNVVGLPMEEVADLLKQHAGILPAGCES